MEAEPEGPTTDLPPVQKAIDAQWERLRAMELRRRSARLVWRTFGALPSFMARAARNVFQVLLFLLANINSSGAQLRRCGDYLLYPNSFETSKIPNYLLYQMPLSRRSEKD